MHLRRTLIAVALSSVCLTMTACSNDEEEAVASLKTQIVANSEMTGGTEVSDTQATCVAQGTVDDIGVDALQEYGILKDDLSVDKSIDGVELEAEDAKALAGVFTDCVDVETLMEDQIVAGLATTVKASERAAAETCVRETVTGPAVEEVLELNFRGSDNTAYDTLRSELAKCLS